MRRLFIFICTFPLSMIVLSQTKSSEACKPFQTIIGFLIQKSESDTTHGYPLGAKRSHSAMEIRGHGYRTHSFYASQAKFPGEQVSEFQENDGKWDYSAIAGVFNNQTILDAAGKKFAAGFLACINKADWHIDEQNEMYLIMSYIPRDIVVSILKSSDPAKFELLISMITFGDKK